jgi:hypothetical protein
VADEETPTNVIDELQSMRDISLTVVRYDRPFNFAEKINIGTLHTDAEFLLFMNDDIEVKTTGAVETLMAYLRDGSVGQVGPMLLFEDGSVQSAGHLLNPAPFDLYRGYPPFLRGGNDMLHVAREVSSIIAAFTLTKSSVFRQVGGLCPMFPGDYNDVDFALKLSEIGLRTVFAPDVQCLHFESQTRIARQDPDAVAMLGSRWQHVLEADPYGNPHLAKYEFVWKADIDTKPALDDAFGCEVEWDDREWAVLNARDDRHLHRTRYFPKWVRLVER